MYRLRKKNGQAIASGLRDKLLEIRTVEKNWPAVAAMAAEEFVRRPSQQAFTECKKACDKAKVWPKVRESLLRYLGNGELPWEQKGWPLPESGLDRPRANKQNRFPLVGDLIDIAILEKKPDQVLRWYDQRPKDPLGGTGFLKTPLPQPFKSTRRSGRWPSGNRRRNDSLRRSSPAPTRKRPDTCEKPPRSCFNKKDGRVAALFAKIAATAPPQTSSDRDPGWLGRKADR